MKIKINQKINFDTNKRPLIVAEISGNHNGSKRNFLNHIKQAAINGADLIKIQTYEPKDITFITMHIRHLNDMKMLLNYPKN